MAASTVEVAPNAATPSGGMKDSNAAAVVHAKKSNQKDSYFSCSKCIVKNKSCEN